MASRSARPQARKFILAVDHDKPILRRLHGLLEGAGYEVHCAESANEAIVAIGNRRPNLVLTDIHLRESDGFELINWMRSHTGSIPVIAMSEGNPRNPGELSMAEHLGAMAIIRKPFSPKLMVSTVARVLAQQGAAT
jgi:CheY-like chemotaxis protein